MSNQAIYRRIRAAGFDIYDGRFDGTTGWYIGYDHYRRGRLLGPVATKNDLLRWLDSESFVQMVRGFMILVKDYHRTEANEPLHEDLVAVMGAYKSIQRLHPDLSFAVIL